ncbi:MAG: aminotransferase class I/II-fold pyridoxal phosphate-dependent enzyme, partial [Luteimonas sp.]|nr:aminotransferase class I/II-fold pyridoxal phosphate-dependent enzyme [Luteimonas sp.]
MANPAPDGTAVSALFDLVRPDLRGFAGYRSARGEGAHGEVWLNANESAWPNPADIDAGCRRYPEPQPRALCDALSSLHGCGPEQLLVGRGSDEAIDLLVRALCGPGRDGVLVTPPVFGMYAVSARLQGAPLLEVPLRDGDAGFGVDFEATADVALANDVKLVFLCSPLNPTGGALALDAIAALAMRLQGRALVVVDEAYGEFSAVPSAVPLIATHSNIAVLRTLSKAHALAAVRIGCVIADAGLVRALRCCQAPYPVPGPCAELALAGLSPSALALTRQRIALIKAERTRMQGALSASPQVARVYES